MITVLNEQARTLQGQVGADFGRHPDAEIYLSQPGPGSVLGARVLGEFGDNPDRYVSGKARKNYAAASPLARASGKKKMVMARLIRNDRLTGALMAQALSALGASPGARASTTPSAHRQPASPRRKAVGHRPCELFRNAGKSPTLLDSLQARLYSDEHALSIDILTIPLRP